MQEPARAGALVKVIRIYNKIEQVGFGKASDYFNIIETASSAVNRSKLVMMLLNASSHYACAWKQQKQSRPRYSCEALIDFAMGETVLQPQK